MNKVLLAWLLTFDFDHGTGSAERRDPHIPEFRDRKGQRERNYKRKRINTRK